MVLQFSLLESKKPVSCLSESLVGCFFSWLVWFFVCVSIFFKSCVSFGVQHSDSDIYICVYVCVCIYIFFFKILFPYKLLQNIEYSSLCYIVGLADHLFYVCVYINPSLLIYSSRAPS